MKFNGRNDVHDSTDVSHYHKYECESSLKPGTDQFKDERNCDWYVCTLNVLVNIECRKQNHSIDWLQRGDRVTLYKLQICIIYAS